MTWAAAAYQQSTHYINNVGVRATCGDCHIPYDSGHATAAEYVKLLLFKADRGAKDYLVRIEEDHCHEGRVGQAPSCVEQVF